MRQQCHAGPFTERHRLRSSNLLLRRNSTASAECPQQRFSSPQLFRPRGKAVCAKLHRLRCLSLHLCVQQEKAPRLVSIAHHQQRCLKPWPSAQAGKRVCAAVPHQHDMSLLPPGKPACAERLQQPRLMPHLCAQRLLRPGKPACAERLQQLRLVPHPCNQLEDLHRLASTTRRRVARHLWVHRQQCHLQQLYNSRPGTSRRLQFPLTPHHQRHKHVHPLRRQTRWSPPLPSPERVVQVGRRPKKRCQL